MYGMSGSVPSRAVMARASERRTSTHGVPRPSPVRPAPDRVAVRLPGAGVAGDDPRRPFRDRLPAVMIYPPWTVLHVPHDSTDVPPEVRDRFVLDDAALAAELARMTDHHTLALFADADDVAVRAPVSRLVVDVERFVDDAAEPMAARGMGCVYTVTADLEPLRAPPSAAERAALIANHYAPHHARLEATVSAALAEHDRCLVIDCHSFPGTALPCELAAPGDPRPDVCIGTDGFHTPDALRHAFVAAFEDEGWSVAVDAPFAGALVPASRYRQDRRVDAVMVEINRGLYVREPGDERLAGFDDVAARVRRCCAAAARSFG